MLIKTVIRIRFAWSCMQYNHILNISWLVDVFLTYYFNFHFNAVCTNAWFIYMHKLCVYPVLKYRFSLPYKQVLAFRNMYFLYAIKCIEVLDHTSGVSKGPCLAYSQFWTVYGIYEINKSSLLSLLIEFCTIFCFISQVHNDAKRNTLTIWTL